MPILDYTNKRFGNWTVISRAKRNFWNTRCDCGSTGVIYHYSLKGGNSKGCQKCKGAKIWAKRPEKHGLRETPEYNAWVHAKNRCFNTKNAKYDLYGGRGIVVCPEWAEDFLSFLAHVGKRPSTLHSLDRIDVNGNYEPGNVRWATAKEQANNRRNSIVVLWKGESIPLAAAAEREGLNPYNLWKRAKETGLSVEAAADLMKSHFNHFHGKQRAIRRAQGAQKQSTSEGQSK